MRTQTINIFIAAPPAIPYKFENTSGDVCLCYNRIFSCELVKIHTACLKKKNKTKQNQKTEKKNKVILHLIFYSAPCQLLENNRYKAVA